MKLKFVIVLLVLGLAAAGFYLYQSQRRAQEQRKTAEDSIRVLSIQLTNTQATLNEQQSVNTVLKTNLALLVKEAEALTNRLVATSSALEATSTALQRAEAQAKAAAEAAAAEIAQRDARIQELQSSNDGLTKSMNELTGEISTLASRIAETQRKLAQSEGDREFLLKELKRLQAEKDELERQFNDLALLRDQVRKLKEELSLARRLDWIRRGLYGSTVAKGGVLLQQGIAKPGTNLPPSDLEVELKTDGSATVNTPTNTPPVPEPAPTP